MALFSESNVYGAVRDPMTMHSLLVQGGLVPEEGTYKCGKCGHPLKLHRDARSIDGLIWVCSFSEKQRKRKGKKVCGTQVTYRHGTFLARSHLSMTYILSFCRVWLLGVRLIDIHGSFVTIDMRTCVDWASLCREVVFHYCLSAKEKLGGPGAVVEIVESKFGKRKYHRGHKVEGQWVFGGYERGSGRIFMLCVDKWDRETLVPLIEEWIVPGTTICWKSYDCLGDLGYKHLKVSHGINFRDGNTVVPTNCMEATCRQTVWGAAKSILSRPGQRSKSHMPGNLSWYMFKKRCDEQKLEIVQEFFRHAGVMYDPRHPRQPTSEAGCSSSLPDDPSPSGADLSSDNPFHDEEDIAE